MLQLYNWKFFILDDSRNIPTALAMECPHCGAIIKVAKETIQGYLDQDIRVIQFRCIETDCESNSRFSEDFDIPFLDLEDTKKAIWAEDSSKLKPRPAPEVSHTDAIT
jgi:hypothetical protein